MTIKVGIIGASTAGLFSAVLIKKEHPSYEVVLIEKNNKIGKKIFATGNGRCNILNTQINPEKYTNSEFVGSLSEDFSYERLNKTLFDLGIITTLVGDYCYPYSFSANCVVEILQNLIKTLGIKVILNETVISYNGTRVKTQSNDYKFDILIFATGGKSSPKLGSDGAMFSLLEKHGYQIKPLFPVLCPIRTKENLSKIAGIRCKANVTLLDGNTPIFEESGEVLFKKDGLSGIVIFNLSRFSCNLGNATIRLNLLADLNDSDLEDFFIKNGKTRDEESLISFFPSELAKYIYNYSKIKGITLLEACKNLEFTFKSNYSFDESQVSRGGIEVSQIKPTLESKLEDNVFFVGEMIDVDGPCGGFNIGWAIYNALILSKSV